MSNGFKFAGVCLVVSTGLATLELVAFVGISSIIALPLTLFSMVSDTFFYTIAAVMGLAAVGIGIWCIGHDKLVTGISVLTSILVALSIGWMLVQTTAFDRVPLLH